DRLADDLRSFLEGLPVSACRPWWARLSRRGWLASGALAALGLAAAVVFFVLAATASTPRIKIGIATVRSGPRSYHAQAIRDGVWLAVQELNEQDDRYDIVEMPAAADAADVARTAEEWMTAGKVDVLIGGATSEE